MFQLEEARVLSNDWVFATTRGTCKWRGRVSQAPARSTVLVRERVAARLSFAIGDA